MGQAPQATPEPEADYPSPVRELPNAVETEPVVPLQKVEHARRVEMTPECRWEYKHIVIPAAEAAEPDPWDGRPTMAKIGRYPSDDVEQRLRSHGQEGWELVSMEPQWFWERLGISMAMEIARPKVITGWYCTFKRKVSAT